MFGAIKNYFFSTPQSTPSRDVNEQKSLKSSSENKKTIVQGSNSKFDFSEEYEDNNENKNQSTESSSIDIGLDISTEKLISLFPQIGDEDYWRMCHSVYVKNSTINISLIPHVPFIKIKRKEEGLLTYIGLSGTVTYDQLNYFVGFDENFLYMINMTKEVNKEKDNEKTVGNHYDLFKLSNIEIVKDEFIKDKILVDLLFITDNDVDNFESTVKKLHFEKQDALKFLKILKVYLNKYEIKITYKDEIFKNINFNETEKEAKIKEEEITDKDEKIIDTKLVKNEENKEEDKKEEKNKEEDKKEDDKKEDDKKEEDKKENDKKEEDKKEEDKKEENKEEEKKEEDKKEDDKKEDENEEKEEEIVTSKKVEETKVEKGDE